MSQTKAQLISDLVQALNFTGTSSAPANGMYLSAANTISLSTNSDGPKLTITSDGKIGLGTTSPDTKLHISSADIGAPQNAGSGLMIEGSSADLQFMSANDSYNHIFFGDPEDPNIGIIAYHHASNSNSMVFTTNTATALTLDSSQNATFAGHVNLPTGYSLQWSDSHERIEQSDGKIEFFTGNGQKMTLSSDNLGIGTSSPSALFDCEIAATDKLEYGNNPRLFLQCATGNNALRIWSDTTPIEARTDNSSRFFMVGGGPSHDTTWAGKTCAADATFDSSPKIFLNATYWNGSASVTAFQTSIQAVATSAASNGGYLGLGASATPDDLVILPTGNVGINVVNPSAYLDVVSNDASAYIAEFRQSNTSNSGQIAIDSPTDSDSRPVFIDLQRAGTVKWSIGQGYNSSGGAFHFATSTLGAGVTNSQVEITTGGNVKIADGDLVIGTDGHGIDFSATSDAPISPSSEILDEYEEGTWAPTLHDASGNNSSFGTVTNANYTRIGDTVRLTVRAVNMLTAGMVGANAVYLKGLPFDTNQYQYAACWIRSPNASNWGPNQNMVIAICDSNQITFQASNGGGGTTFTWDDVTNNSTDLFMTLVYRAT